MTRSLPATLTLLGLALAAAMPAHAEGKRDEALARRFLHCANVAELWAEVLKDKDAENAQNQVRIRDLFLAASEWVSDPDYPAKQQAAAMQGVKALMARQDKEKKDLLGPETASCSDTFQKQAVPVLQQKMAVVRAAAAAASAASGAASAASTPR